MRKLTLKETRLVVWTTLACVLIAAVCVTYLFWDAENTRTFGDTFNTAPPKEDGDRWIHAFAGPTLDGLLASISLISVDAIGSRISLRIALMPQGSFSATGGLLTKTVSVVACDENTQRTFPAGTHLPPIDVANLFCEEGDATLYPLDVYNCSCPISAWVGNVLADNITIIPLGVYKFSGNVATFVSLPEVFVYPFGAAFILELQRGLMTKMTAIVGCVMMWMLTLSLFVIAVDGLITGSAIDLPSVGWYLTLMFALPTFRNNLPGQVPVGGAIDISTYFWCQLLTVVGAVIMTVRYGLGKSKTA